MSKITDIINKSAVDAAGDKIVGEDEPHEEA